MSFLIPQNNKSGVNISRVPKGPKTPQLKQTSALTIQSDSRGAGTQTHSNEEEIEEQSSSVINFYPAWCRCFSCLLAKKYRRTDDVPTWTRFKNAFLCPPSGVLSRFLYFFFFNALVWVFTWGLDKDIARDSISALIVLELLGLVCGIFMKLINMPSLLAPLIIGIVLNNVRFDTPHFKFRFFGGLHRRGWIEPIRHIALTIILTRAGTELSPKQLRKMKGLVPAAAFTPCIVEACTCAGVMYAFFQKEEISIAMCFVAGFALAAVSPAVVVPGMISLQKKNYGVKEGIPTLLIAASSIDDVLAISAYSIALSFTKETKTEKWKNYAGPGGVIVGLLHGIIVGIILHFIPSRDKGRNIYHLRIILLLLFNFACMFIYEQESLRWLSGSGSLGVLTTSFIASFGWRSVPYWKYGMRKIETALAHIWTLFVPLLFGTIGNEIDLYTFEWDVVGKLVAVIAVSLVARLTTMFLISGCAKIKKKEMLFCAISWIPKATVQATLAPLVASEFENEPDGNPQKKFSKYVVWLAVLGILLTAPSGAILISMTGKRLLRQSKNEPEEFPYGGDETDEVTEIVARNSSAEREMSKGSEVLFADIPLEGGLVSSGKLPGPDESILVEDDRTSPAPPKPPASQPPPKPPAGQRSPKPPAGQRSPKPPAGQRSPKPRAGQRSPKPPPKPRAGQRSPKRR